MIKIKNTLICLACLICTTEAQRLNCPYGIEENIPQCTTDDVQTFIRNVGVINDTFFTNNPSNYTPSIVAAYICHFHKLPNDLLNGHQNRYITRESCNTSTIKAPPKAYTLYGVECKRNEPINKNCNNGGKLRVCYHKMIGGNIFGNRVSYLLHDSNKIRVVNAKILPDLTNRKIFHDLPDSTRKYIEADVGFPTGFNRGTERIVYNIRNDTCFVYYTNSHYCSYCSFPPVIKTSRGTYEYLSSSSVLSSSSAAHTNAPQTP